MPNSCVLRIYKILIQTSNVDHDLNNHGGNIPRNLQWLQFFQFLSLSYGNIPCCCDACTTPRGISSYRMTSFLACVCVCVCVCVCAFLFVSFTLLILLPFAFLRPSLCPKGLVPKSEVQREAHEAAEHSERPETRVFPRPEEDESAGRETGGGGARALLLLWRWAVFLEV